jgi:hypothetical protein
MRILLIVISVLLINSSVFGKPVLRWSFSYLEDKKDKELTDFIEISPLLKIH